MRVRLEPQVQALAEATALPAYLFHLGPDRGRAVTDRTGNELADAPAVDVTELAVLVGAYRRVPVRIVRPPRSTAPLPVIIYLHGAGGVFGSSRRHERLVRELASRVNAAVVFPSYGLSPAAGYPTAVEECYGVAAWVASSGLFHGLDGTRIAVAGDSLGGNMTIALGLLAAQRRDVEFCLQVLFYPVTDARFDIASYSGSHEGSGTGYFLRADALQWLCEQYAADAAMGSDGGAPALDVTSEHLTPLPPTLVITAEAEWAAITLAAETLRKALDTA